ncbi:MAG: peptidoglycan recognition family protein [Phycisphaerae bacterium]|nr:peptidoglycan recognition family protein [Phycisphaerae bacterium]
MNPMLPVRYVTVHHDGLDLLETGTADAAMAARIELYRAGHRGKGWGDIGYHFVIDRAGTVWEARNLKWQGAHVKDRNEGNVGILVMGNFEIQRPTPAQLVALRDHVRAVCTYYTIPWTRVFSHQEWPGAQTLCPGANLQREFIAVRTGERSSERA